MSIHHVLAATDEGIGKFVIAVVFITIWVISAVASAINKKTTELKRRRAMGQMLPESGRRRSIEPRLAEAIRQKLPPVDVRPPQRGGNVQRAANAAARKAQQLAQKRKAAQRPAPPPLPRVEQAILLEERPAPIPVTPAPEISRRPTGVAAPAIRRWLTPATLRQQFILTELLQPPKALRADEYNW